MDLVCVILFLVLYYVRPQEWSSIFSAIHFVQIVMLMALFSLFGGQKQVRLGDLFKTPHDWMILLFFGWMILSNDAPYETFKSNFALAIFYFVIVQTMTSVRRLNIFVGWWTGLTIFVAALAIMSNFGVDPLGSMDITTGRMKGRLILNLSIFNNPNALGHSVVPCIPMIYFFCFWKRPLFIKQIGTLLIGIPIWCVFLTASKGAFLTGGAVLVATLAFGRPKTVQILILVVTAAVGGTAMHSLPRMNELEKAKSDQAIQGRVAAFTHGMKVMQDNIRGVGRGNWMESFLRTHHYGKACHSSYVQVGAELGYPGLFLFLGILYCCLRTLLTMKANTPEVERIRRTLFVLVLSYMISSWMVDFGFRASFFMFAAGVASLHRIINGLVTAPETVEEKISLPGWRPHMIPRPGVVTAPALAAMAPPAPIYSLPKVAIKVPPPPKFVWMPKPATSRSKESPSVENAKPKGAEEEIPADETAVVRGIDWMKFGFIDFAMVLTMTITAVKLWQMAIRRM